MKTVKGVVYLKDAEGNYTDKILGKFEMSFDGLSADAMKLFIQDLQERQEDFDGYRAEEGAEPW